MINLRSKDAFLRTNAQISDAFSLVDYDGDFKIGTSDLFNLFQELEEPVSMEYCREMIFSVCGELDGSVTLSQFTELAKEYGSKSKKV